MSKLRRLLLASGITLGLGLGYVGSTFSPVKPASADRGFSRRAEAVVKPSLPDILGKDRVAVIEKILSRYRQEPARVRIAAQKLENDDADSWSWKMAVILYQRIGDGNAATKILKKKYLAGTDSDHLEQLSGYHPAEEDLIKRVIAGVDPLYGDWGPTDLHSNVQKICTPSRAESIRRRVAESLEKRIKQDPEHSDEYLSMAASCYGLSDKGRNQARALFVRSRESQADKLKSWGIPITSELYAARGDYWFGQAQRDGFSDESDLEDAFSLYKRAGQVQKMRKILRIAEQKHSAYLASRFALALGEREKAQQYATQAVLENPLHPVEVERILEAVGLNTPTMYQRIAAARREAGEYQEAIKLYEKAGDYKGVESVLKAMTTE